MINFPDVLFPLVLGDCCEILRLRAVLSLARAIGLAVRTQEDLKELASARVMDGLKLRPKSSKCLTPLLARLASFYPVLFKNVRCHILTLELLVSLEMFLVLSFERDLLKTSEEEFSSQRLLFPLNCHSFPFLACFLQTITNIL